MDTSLYPDVEYPVIPISLCERVDFLARLCGSWDFGVLPDVVTVQEVRRDEWREAVDDCRMLTSPAYHLLRRWHGLEPLPFLGQKIAMIQNDPCLNMI